jgi:hypothetical protein
MKQTAVEWLQQALEDTILTHEQIMQTIGLFEQAKEMEKEQMCEFADEFAIECINFHHEKTMSQEKFFDLTFNTNEKRGSGQQRCS